ncbi:hypothetical protein EV360DRAFT_58343 [Lentinula raphanica]|nr:hypothetical protein EV360DRAFT_58343 [Lentinula raphanica]
MTSFPCPLLRSTQVLVDDGDPHILYSPGWGRAGTIGFECNSSTHESNYTVNSTAIFTFVGDCTGNYIEVFGTVGASQKAPTSIYQVDDLPISTYTFPVNGQNNYRVPFYLSPLLELGNHTLTIIVPPGKDGNQLYLDYIIYDSSGPTSISSSVAPTPFPTPISSPTPESSSPTPLSLSALPTCQSSSSIDVIASGVGGSLGGIIIGLSTLTIIVLYSNRIKCMSH